MNNDNFAVFILSHGRPNDVFTFDTLKKQGYTGKIYIIIDNTDKSSQRYIDKFGVDNVIIFNKQEVANTTDQGDNLNDLRTTTHARNAIFDAAKKMNINTFVQLDDDYTAFEFRTISGKKLLVNKIKNLDKVFNSFAEFLNNTPTTSIALAQGGDFIGGADNPFVINGGLKRKCMNSFFCSTDKPFKFVSRLNEDVNTYLTLGNTGSLFFTSPLASLVQKQTQKTKGGMSETYLDNGTYQKSFFSVMYAPYCVKLRLLGGTKRIHHSITWDNAVPCIIDETHKKNNK